jgi:hypothetical protein
MLRGMLWIWAIRSTPQCVRLPRRVGGGLFEWLALISWKRVLCCTTVVFVLRGGPEAENVRTCEKKKDVAKSSEPVNWYTKFNFEHHKWEKKTDAAYWRIQQKLLQKESDESHFHGQNRTIGQR